jgi:SOS response regulatory protein OraA/RecX
VPRVTGLRPHGDDRVEVDLDGRPWRTVPADAVVRAGVREGLELDRPRLRALRRELRRSEALAVAAKTLRRRDASTRDLEARLQRRGVPSPARADALELLTAAGLVDDARLANATAEALARRGWGDAAIAYRLEQLGVDADAAASAQALLEPEEARATRIVETRGRSRRTAAYLARRGFSEDTVERVLPAAVADGDAEGYDTPSSPDIFPA